MPPPPPLLLLLQALLTSDRRKRAASVQREYKSIKAHCDSGRRAQSTISSDVRYDTRLKAYRNAIIGRTIHSAARISALRWLSSRRIVQGAQVHPQGETANQCCPVSELNILLLQACLHKSKCTRIDERTEKIFWEGLNLREGDVCR